MSVLDAAEISFPMKYRTRIIWIAHFSVEITFHHGACQSEVVESHDDMFLQTPRSHSVCLMMIVIEAQTQSATGSCCNSGQNIHHMV